MAADWRCSLQVSHELLGLAFALVVLFLRKGSIVFSEKIVTA